MSFFAQMGDHFEREDFFRVLLAFFDAFLFMVAGNCGLYAQGINRALCYAETARTRSCGAGTGSVRFQDDRPSCANLSYKTFQDLRCGYSFVPTPINSFIQCLCK